ncbi:uncharacterized protein LOC142566284 [Dermacentor variabilis]|uniref:uncharacterized protein LOC142566284 n=1 Tax=Dermacentor variabilis TaxID=34621 RepID=UPI003F5C908C
MPDPNHHNWLAGVRQTLRRGAVSAIARASLASQTARASPLLEPVPQECGDVAASRSIAALQEHDYASVTVPVITAGHRLRAPQVHRTLPPLQPRGRMTAV